MKKKQAFITGGAGFIGRWVVERCRREGFQVAVYDNLCAGRIDNLLEFMDQITFYEADILDAASLSVAMRETAPDVVFHLAAHHFIPYCNAHPQETMRVNVEGTYAVLTTAAECGAQIAVTASTGAIYPSLDSLLHEGITPAPPDIYGLSKLLTEHIATYVARMTSLHCVAARLFNTYGPYETNPHLIPHIMECLHEGPSVELGNVHTKRDYIYVEDVARLLFACSQADVTGFRVVNVGTGSEYTAKEIVEVIGGLIGEPVQIHVDESRVRSVDKMHQRADTSGLQELTGTLPKYSLTEGLASLLRHEKLHVAEV